MSHPLGSEFKRDELCLFRKHGEIDAMILRIVGPTAGSVGGRTMQPGGTLSQPAPSHWHYHTNPPVPAGAWGQYLTRVPNDFAAQVAIYLEELAHDPGILNNMQAVAGKAARISGLRSTAEVRFPAASVLPWAVLIDGEEIATTNEPFSRKALKTLASLISNRISSNEGASARAH